MKDMPLFPVLHVKKLGHEVWTECRAPRQPAAPHPGPPCCFSVEPNTLPPLPPRLCPCTGFSLCLEHNPPRSLLDLFTHMCTHTQTFCIRVSDQTPPPGRSLLWPPPPWSSFVLLYNNSPRSSLCDAAETNPPRNHEVSGSIPGLT